ncbi:MAG: peptide chain release factor N(5)-glutamine methyltransferase [Alteromonadaceae bacterium]|nr:peptide chain release factor N(5)-glutamine methyltransferase [Alteromonadaceae bacterium]
MPDKSLANLVEYGRHRLSTLSDTDSAKLDAQILLCFVLNKASSYLLTWPDKKINEAQYQNFLNLLERRVQGEPIAYITGTKEFWSLSLFVSSATLIPRPDTETLVEQILSDHCESHLSCLDLGTGTGAIALALASEMPNWQIDAVDFNADAVLLAQKNAENNNLTQVNIYQSDWFRQILLEKTFDVIVSNPPYIDNIDEHLSQGDVRFEPKSALVAEQQGLADIIHIATEARKYFAEQGFLLLEHGYEQSAQVQKILSELGYSEIKTVKDLSGNDRITKARYLLKNR